MKKVTMIPQFLIHKAVFINTHKVLELKKIS